ncbi:hypothetical protein GCM10022227_03820 [Streptomyces sedi]
MATNKVRAAGIPPPRRDRVEPRDPNRTHGQPPRVLEIGSGGLNAETADLAEAILAARPPADTNPLSTRAVAARRRDRVPPHSAGAGPPKARPPGRSTRPGELPGLASPSLGPS